MHMPKTMRILAVLALTLTALVGLAAAPAHGQGAGNPCPPGQPPGRPPGTPPGNPPVDTGRPQYPPGRCQLALSQSAAGRGETFQASGGGFVPGEQVTLSIAGNPVKTVTADSNGAFAADLTVPGNAPFGATQVAAAGANQTLTAAFEVTAAPARTSSGREGASLPRTGVEIAATVALALVLIALGGLAVAWARERRQVLA
jgi:hypothetical protein